VTTWTDHPFSQRSGPDCHDDSREPRDYEEQPREYVTEISVPSFDDGRQALYSPGLREPEPEAGAPEPEPEAGS
jgi:hypothetical protein